ISVSSYSSVVPFKYRKLFGSTKMRAPCSSKILSRSRACVSRRMAYDNPEQPPPCTPTRRPPCSGETPSFSSSSRILRSARSVRLIFAIFGLATSVAMVKCSKTLRIRSRQARAQQAAPLQGKHERLSSHENLVRRLFVDGHFDAVLFLPVADGGLNGVFGEHGTVNLDGRERKLTHDVRVLDRKRLFDRLALDPLGGERGAGDGRPAAEGLELGFFNDLGIGIDLHLQLHHVAAFRCADETRSDVGVFLRHTADVTGIVVVINHFIAVCHYPLLLARLTRLPKPALLTALSVSETFGTEAERPAVN